MILGCIADDFTGATDLANTLVQGGMRTLLIFGVPEPTDDWPRADALVVALKSRSIPPDEAVALSVRSWERLEALGVRKLFFKYCSTFDSTDRGNIGPVAEALLEAIGGSRTLFCPAFPANGRTVYQGHLFVGDRPLDESGMEHHPLNPMTDADLVRVLARQSCRPVGLLPYRIVDRGAEVIKAHLETLEAQGRPLIVADALTERHLHDLALGSVEDRLITGGSGIALGLPRLLSERFSVPLQDEPPGFPQLTGPSVVLSGSCSSKTRQQVAAFRQAHPCLELEIEAILSGDPVVESALRWAGERVNSGPVLISTTADPERVRSIQERHGREASAEAIEGALARIARGLVGIGVRRLVVAGGETSGAIVNALGIRAIRIGPQIAPGVPWTWSLGEPTIALALKSGNFGGETFFVEALEMWP